jgi:hypothetical protein
MGRQLSTPSAILLGSATIAVAVYFGARHGLEARCPEDLPPAPAVARTVGVAPQPAFPVAAPAASITPRDEAARQAAEALEAHRATLVERCWKPSVAVQPTLPASRYVFTFTFDASGQQRARGVAEDRQNARPDVTSCLTTTLPALRIPPPGVPLRVDLPFSLP